jgi:hypothetical protein
MNSISCRRLSIGIRGSKLLFSYRGSSSGDGSLPQKQVGREEIKRVVNLDLTGKRIDVKWGQSRRPIKPSTEREIAKVLLARGEFRAGSKLSEQRIAEIADTLERVGGYITMDQALSLRKQLLVEKIINTSTRMQKSSEALRHAYEKGRNILALSKKFDLPPVAIFRNILTYRARRRYPDLYERDLKDLVKFALRGEGDVYLNLLNDRDREELEIAKAEDQTSFANDNNERIVSAHWENALYSYLNTT